MTPDEAAAPLMYEWNEWRIALRDVGADYARMPRGTGGDFAVSDMRYLMSAISERMGDLKDGIDEIAKGTSPGTSMPGSGNLASWLRSYETLKDH